MTEADRVRTCGAVTARQCFEGQHGCKVPDECGGRTCVTTETRPDMCYNRDKAGHGPPDMCYNRDKASRRVRRPDRCASSRRVLLCRFGLVHAEGLWPTPPLSAPSPFPSGSFRVLVAKGPARRAPRRETVQTPMKAAQASNSSQRPCHMSSRPAGSSVTWSERSTVRHPTRCMPRCMPSSAFSAALQTCPFIQCVLMMKRWEPARFSGACVLTASRAPRCLLLRSTCRPGAAAPAAPWIHALC